VSIPFADDGVMPNSIELHGISAGILNGNGQLTVTHAECWFGDIHLTLRGSLLNPEVANARRSPQSSDDVARRARCCAPFCGRWIVFILASRIRTFHQPYRRLLQPDDIIAKEITLQAGAVQIDKLRFDRVNLDATFANRTAHLTSLRTSGPDGSILIAGDWDFANGSGRFDVSGGLNWAPLLLLAGRADLAEQIAFDKPPELEATVTAGLARRGRSFFRCGQGFDGGVSIEGDECAEFLRPSRMEKWAALRAGCGSGIEHGNGARRCADGTGAFQAHARQQCDPPTNSSVS